MNVLFKWNKLKTQALDVFTKVTCKFQISFNLYCTILEEVNLEFNYNEYFNCCGFDWLYTGMVCPTNNFFFQRHVRVEMSI